MGRRPTDEEWEKLAFNLLKKDSKYVAHCNVCQKELKNTSTDRLFRHRNICKISDVNEQLLKLNTSYSTDTLMHHDENFRTTFDSSDENEDDVIAPNITEQITEYDDALLEPKAEHYNDVNEWSKEDILNLIKFYQKHEVLYNPNHIDYKNKSIRSQAYKDITLKMRAIHPFLNANEIKLKIINLREQYSREILKQDKSINYEPTTQWLASMEFLKDYVPNVRERRKRDSYNNICSDHGIDNISNDTSFSYQPPPKMIRVDPDISNYLEQEYVAPQLSNISSLSTVVRNNGKNEDDTFSNYIKEEMYAVKDEDLKDELRQKITTTIFEFKKKQRDLDKAKS